MALDQNTAEALAQAYNRGDFDQVNTLLGSGGISAQDVQSYFNFDSSQMADLGASGINFAAPPAPVYTPAAPTPVYEPAYEPVYEPAVYTPPATNAYFQSNPDVAAAYAGNSYGMSADDFANFHYNNYGKNEGRYSPSGEPPPRAVVETPAPAAPTYSQTDEQGTPIYETPPAAVVEQTPVDTVAENYWREQAALQQAEWERQAAEQQREWERQAASTPVVTEPTPVPQTPVVTTPSIVDTITAGPPTTEEEFLEIVSTPPATTPVTSTPETPTNQYTKENWPTINYGTTGTDGETLTTTTTSDGTPFYLRDEDGGGMYQNPATVETYVPYTGEDGKTYYKIHAPTFSSGKAATETPVTGYMTEDQFRKFQGGSTLGDAVQSVVNSPAGSFALNVLGPYGQAINAANQASQGNVPGAILGGLNAAGGFGVTDIGGFAIKDVQNVARGLNAINRDDLAGALTAGANLFGGTPGEYATATNLASAGLALKNNDAAGFASAMSDLTKNPDLKIAAAAVKLLDAVNADTINPSALQAAINGLNSAVNKTSTTPTQTVNTEPAITTLSDEDKAELQPGELQAYEDGGVQGLANFRRDVRLLNNLTTSGRTGDDLGGNTIDDVIKDSTTATPDTGTKVSDAVTLPSGTQLASVGSGFDVGTVSGAPIFAESANAKSITAPFGFRLTSASETDNKPQGSFYDPTTNAWFSPDTAVTDLLNNATIKSDADLFNQALGDVDKTTTDTSGTTVADTTDLGTLLDEVTATGSNTDSGLSNQDLLDLTNITDDTVVVKGGANTPATDAGTASEVGGGKATDLGGVTIVGDRPTDTVTGATGADTITGATGNDNVETVTVTGGTGNDSITGGTENDGVEELVVTGTKECAPGFHDDGTGLCVPDDDIEENPCAEGYHLVNGLCVPDEDIEEDTECPEGYIRNLETGACEKVEVTTPVVKPPVVVQPPVVKPPIKKVVPEIPAGYVPSTGGYTSAEETKPIYAGAMDDFDLFATLEELLKENPDKKKDNKKSKDKTKMATGGHLDDLLAEQMTVDDLLKLLR